MRDLSRFKLKHFRLLSMAVVILVCCLFIWFLFLGRLGKIERAIGVRLPAEATLVEVTSTDYGEIYYIKMKESDARLFSNRLGAHRGAVGGGEFIPEIPDGRVPEGPGTAWISNNEDAGWRVVVVPELGLVVVRLVGPSKLNIDDALK
jgi:hypothetical protein